MTFEEYAKTHEERNTHVPPVVRDLFWKFYGVTGLHERISTITQLAQEAEKAVHTNNMSLLREDLACMVSIIFELAEHANIDLPEAIYEDLYKRSPDYEDTKE